MHDIDIKQMTNIFPMKWDEAVGVREVVSTVCIGHKARKLQFLVLLKVKDKDKEKEKDKDEGKDKDKDEEGQGKERGQEKR